MPDSLPALSLPPASRTSPTPARPSSVPAKNHDDKGGFADMLSRSSQDADSADSATAAVAASGEDDRKDAVQDAQTNELDAAATTNAADIAALLAMMGADTSIAVLPAAMLLAPPAPLPTTGDSSDGAGEGSATQVRVALASSDMTMTSLTAMLAGAANPETTAIKLVGTAAGLNDHADASAELLAGHDGASTDAIKTIAAARALAKSVDAALGSAEARASNLGASADVIKAVSAASASAKSDGASELAITTFQGTSLDTPAVVNLVTAGTIPVPITPAAVPATIASLIPTHLDSPAWSKDFGQHIIRLAIDGQPAAEIHLNPPELGPIKVLIDIRGGETALQFFAEHATTRDALEASLSRLREIFAAGGITLAHVNVEDQPQSQSQSQSGFSQNPSNGQQRGFDWAEAMKDVGRLGITGVGGINGSRGINGLTLGIDDNPSTSASPIRLRASDSQVDLFA